MDKNSLAHTKWNCKYHIVFTPKYRRQAIYGKIKKDIGAILRKLCVCIEGNKSFTNDYYDMKIKEAIKQIIPYYEYVISKI